MELILTIIIIAVPVILIGIAGIVIALDKAVEKEMKEQEKKYYDQ